MAAATLNRLPKIAPPRLHAPVARERLFTKLDERARYPVIWVSGPPGSGKTTLVASYLAARKVRAHWYQVDSGDSDPASLFLYLGELAKSFGTKRGAAPLPYFTPEYRGDLAGFARRFFREFFGRMRSGDVLVLDNVHECAGTVFDDVLREACAELPAGHGLIGISRTEAPPSLSKWRACGDLLELGWPQMRLTAEESEAMMAAAGHQRADASALHCQADGWAAGLVLLAANAEGTDFPGGPSQLAAKESVFAYFAGEVFDRAPADMKEVLMSTSLFPEVTPGMAAAISGNPEAGHVLEGLYRRHYFTSRKSQPQLAYQYHDLFREFLQQKLRAQCGAPQVAQLQREAAHILSQVGRHDAAAQLLAGAGDWEGLARLLQRVAGPMLEQGRSRTLLRWLSDVPEESVGTLPWLRYWAAMATAQIAASEAVPMFEQALARFEATGDFEGELASLCGLVESEYYRFRAFGNFEKWLPRMRRLVETYPFEPGSAVELRAVTALLVLANHCGPDPDFVAELTRRATVSLERNTLPPLLRVEAGSLVLLTRSFQGHVEDGPRLVTVLDRAAADTVLPPFRRAHSLWVRAIHGTLQGEFLEVIRLATEAAELCRQGGFRTLLQSVLTTLLAAELLVGRPVAEIEGHVLEFEAVTDEASAQHVLYRAGLTLFRSGLEVSAERRDAIIRDLERAASDVRSVMTRLFSCVWRVPLVVRSEGPAQAAKLVEAAADAVARTELSRLDFLVDLAEVHVALAEGNHARTHAAVEAFFRKAAASPAAGILVWSRALLPDVVAFAWEHGIAPAFARALVVRYRLSPPDGAQHWPWPVRIGVLGGFRLETSGTPDMPKAGKKPPHRLLDLLKALVCLGPEVSMARLGEALWPDAEGDQMQSNLSASVHRLRKLLGRDDAIAVRDGSLSLNPSVCHVDAWAFEHQASVASDCGGIAESNALVRAEKALDLYRGHLLPQEYASWAAERRERLRSRMLRLVLALGRAYESTGQVAQAIAVYERLVELEPGSELGYRHLMRLLGSHGRIAEARDVYQRCRRSLSSVLGTSPSAETVAVFEALRESA